MNASAVTATSPVSLEARLAELDLGDIAARVYAGERLDIEDGERLFACPDPTAVGALAHEVRTRLHGDAAFWVRNLHINYTNVCVNECAFCAFQRTSDEQPGAFTLSVADAAARIRALDGRPLSEIHIVGGCHPGLPLEYYEELLATVREMRPEASLKCFTAVEIAHFADTFSMSVEDVLERLAKAGLDMLPGGGAEIFAPRVRSAICPNKISGERWLEVTAAAHRLGLRTNATMLFGHRESTRERLEHLDALRRLQDETGGFLCFIPLPFLTQNNSLEDVPPLTGVEELKTIAVSRLMLDNILHIKAYWVMLGIKQAQTALLFGADDFDGTVVEEKIGRMAGADAGQVLMPEEIETMIRGLRLTPVERDARFRRLCREDA